MKRFTYKAKEQGSSKVIKGTIQAESERAAGKLLMDRGYIPESIRDEADGVMKSKKVSANARITFTRSFATLIGAGLPLAQSLRTVAEQTDDAPMKALIEEVLADIEAGRSLGDAFSKHDDVFSNVYLALIRAGEVSGTLDYSLKRIAEQEEKDAKTKSAIIGAMTYPCIALAVILVVFIYMMVSVVPEVEKLYVSVNEELPKITEILISIKNFIINQWYIALLIVGVIVFLIDRFRRTDMGIEFMAKFKLNVPMFGQLFRTLYMARFARTAQILLSTGVSVLDTLNISAEAMNNVVVERSIMSAAEKVKSGKPFSEAIRDQPNILPLIPQMSAIGEQSGKMDEMLGKAAQVYEDEFDEKVAGISKMIEPIMLILLGGIAGVLVAGVLFPIYALVEKIS